MPLSPNLRGALFMSISMAGYTLNDALIKLVLADMNFGQVMLVRGIFASGLIGVFAWHHGAVRLPREMLHPMVALRVGAEVCATLCFIVALAYLPLANIAAIMQALPLAVTMGAALFLAEPVGWRRWLAILIGFGGVMIIVRPGFEGFDAFSLLALMAVVFAAIRDIATRRIPDHIPSLLISTATSVAVTLVGGVLMMPLGGWSPMTLETTGLLIGAAVLLLFGYHFIITAMRSGEISFVAPFRYTALIWAMVAGYLIFAEVPDFAMIVGALVIVCSGLYTLYRERKVAGAQPAAKTTGPRMAPDGT
ncbi:EamA family transporter [Chelativorans sp. ZYF759]|uniref:DMT family transporter n=1 Tax=Chelativorans sp. ZYF759 TaxID=2692213 RepID=UPI00145FA3A1|nr:DMT family transporter [Chelativorans sp. ZYF759]NMG39113.1 EamA family transporter [Chelativorans sp. ZYF759]